MARIIYIHVPKCGGSSFGAGLRLRYLASCGVITLGQGDARLTGEARIMSDYAARARQLHAFVAARKRFITGHVRYDAPLHDGAASDYRFVTLLRDPVARFVSHYNYLQRQHPDANRPQTLAGFLDTADARRLASQYLFYFAGRHQGQTDDLPAAMEKAIAALRRFDVIGDLDNTPSFLRDLRRLTRTPLPQWQRNAAPVPTQIPSDLRSRIADLCAPDMAIYRALIPSATCAA